MKNYTITVNGTKYEVTVEEGNVSASSVQTAAPVQAAAPAPAQSGNQGGVRILAPMGGKILSVKASVGASVKKGQCILTFEVLKMENEIVAPQDGVIASINCSVNDKFESGALLATLK